MKNSKILLDMKQDVSDYPINEKSSILKKGNLFDYKKKLLKLHLDEGTVMKKVDDIIKEPEFIECLNFKSHQELTDFLHEFFSFFGYFDITESVINELFERILEVNPSEKFRGFVDDRMGYIKLHIVNGRFVKSHKLKSVFPDKHKQLRDLKTKNLTKLKTKTKIKPKKSSKKKTVLMDKGILRFPKRSTKRGNTDTLNKSDYKPENFISSKSSIHTVKIK